MAFVGYFLSQGAVTEKVQSSAFSPLLTEHSQHTIDGVSEGSGGAARGEKFSLCRGETMENFITISRI